MERILIPVDGSPLSQSILDHVRSFFGVGVAVRLLRVLTDAEVKGSTHRSALSDARGFLDGLAKKVAKSGADVSTSVLVGDPAAKILEAVGTWRPALVAMSTHGRSGVARLVRGSVAERVLRECRRPMLLVNPFGETTKRVRRVLVPLDGSTPAASVLKVVKDVAVENGAEVVLFHVVPRGGEDVEDAITTRAEAKDYLASVEPMLEGVKTRIVAGSGAPAAAILRAAAREKADLIAMTTHGRSGVARWVFGSVAENVLRACRCPLLVYRTA